MKAKVIRTGMLEKGQIFLSIPKALFFLLKKREFVCIMEQFELSKASIKPENMIDASPKKR